MSKFLQLTFGENYSFFVVEGNGKKSIFSPIVVVNHICFSFFLMEASDCLKCRKEFGFSAKDVEEEKLVSESEGSITLLRA